MTILDQGKPAHAAAAGGLQSEPIIWLITVTPSGQPQSTPVWFLWQDGEFLIYGAKNGPKNESIEANRHVSLHLEGNGMGGANSRRGFGVRASCSALTSLMNGNPTVGSLVRSWSMNCPR